LGGMFCLRHSHPRRAFIFRILILCAQVQLYALGMHAGLSIRGLGTLQAEVRFLTFLLGVLSDFFIFILYLGHEI